MADDRLPEQITELIASFEKFFCSDLANDPLIKSELAILRTFCWFLCRRVKVQFDEDSITKEIRS